MSVDEVQSQIQAANETVNNLSTTYQSAGTTAEQMAQQFSSMSAEGAAAQMSEVARLLGEIPAILAQAVEKANEAHSAAEGVRTLGGADGPAVLALDLAAKRPTDVDVPPFDPRRHNPVCWQGLGPYRDVDTAQANLFFPDGRRWNTEPIQAHKKNAADNARGLRPEYRSMRAVWHVEGSVAAWMREEGNQRMVLYMNTTKCLAPDGCDKQLHKLLPEGAVLYVHAVQPNGKPATTRVVGTGEAIEND